jgi:hypothetical protein
MAELAVDFEARLRAIVVDAKTAQEFRDKAAWWEREAERGYSSSADSRWYARNMHGAAERRERDGKALPWTPGYDVPAPRAVEAKR